MRYAIIAVFWCCVMMLSAFGAETGSVIFIHPDGTSASSWAAARALYVGPDGELNWDRLPAMALYRGHMADSLTATSNGGGTTHAFGVKVASDAYGRTAGVERGMDIVDDSGESLSVAMQAIRAGLQVAVVQTGILTEPGTGCFLAFTVARDRHDEIASQLLGSGARIILGGGEKYFLPLGVGGRHGGGMRLDGRNLVEEAKQAGFVVVYTRDELLALDAGTEKVLGLFAHEATFNDQSEEALRAAGLSPFDPGAPTVAEMTEVALRLLRAREERFLLLVEEEGTDNLGNHNNAGGMMEAMHRADQAIGVARADVAAHPETLLLTASDSDAGGMRMKGIPMLPALMVPERLAARDPNGAPVDGVGGTETAPFVAQPDARGRRLPFYIVWASRDDVSGGVLVRGEGLNSELIRGNMDNTAIAALMRKTLLGSSD